MKLGLLGIDAQTLALAEAATAAGHALTLAWNAEAASAALSDLAPSLQNVPHWEDLLNPSQVDAILVASSPDGERLAEQLRKLVQAEVPLLVSHPLGLSMLVYYELDMIRRETQASLLPNLFWRLSPCVERLRAAVHVSDVGGAAPGIGHVEQLLFERALLDRSRAAVLDAFARDVDVIRAVAGEIVKVGALGSVDAAESYASLGVQMSAGDGRAIRWSVTPALDRPEGRLALVGAQGKLTLRLPETGPPWLDEPVSGPPPAESPLSPPLVMLAALEETLAAPAAQKSPIDWSHAAKAVELTETVERSLKKGRTIELHQEEFSEAGTFKGLMTSLGCGLLLAAIAVLFAAAVVQKIAEEAGWRGLAALIGYWPYVLLLCLAVFLLLQSLLRVARQSKS